MIRRTPWIALTVLAVLVGGCAREAPSEDPADAAFAELVEAWNATDTAEEKAALAESYLAEYPDTEHSGTMAGVIAYYRGEELDDPAAAWQIISNALAAIDDPERRFEVAIEAFHLGDEVAIPLDLSQIADDLAAVRPLTSSERADVAEAAVTIESWQLAQKHALAAAELATVARYRTENPDTELTDAQVESRVRHREGSARALLAWATYKLGDTERAAARFAEAEAAGSVNVLGVPTTPLYRYWGRAELAEGNLDRALELLSAEALFGADGETAEPFLRQAYAAKFDSEEGFEEYLWSMRSRLAKPAPDFVLSDYDGTPHALSDTAGQVTLLAFWFPT